jgi:OST3 / OST6 family, transporter family
METYKRFLLVTCCTVHSVFIFPKQSNDNVHYNRHTRLYRVTSNKTSFDRLVGSKKYAFVLFYKIDTSEKNSNLLAKETVAYKKVSTVFRGVSEYEKHKNRNDLVFVEVNVANKDGQELFDRYSIESLPGYVLLVNGKEARDLLQTYPLSANMTEEQIDLFLDNVLQ